MWRVPGVFPGAYPAGCAKNSGAFFWRLSRLQCRHNDSAQSFTGVVHAVHKVGHPNLDQIAMPTTQAQTIAPHWEESTVCNRPAPLAVHFRPADTGGLCLFIYSDSCTSIYCCTSSVCSLHSRSVIVLFVATWAARKSPIPMSDECDSWTHKAR